MVYSKDFHISISRKHPSNMVTSKKIIHSLLGTFFVILGIAELLLPRIVNWVLGSFFITLGIAGIILPIINGTFFLIIGLILISFESRYVETKLHRLTSKSKLLHTWHLNLEKYLRKIFRKESSAN